MARRHTRSQRLAPHACTRALVLTQSTAPSRFAAPLCTEVKEGHGLFDSDMPEDVRVQRDSAKGLAIKAHTSEYHK